MTDIEKLIAIEEIKCLKARYFRSVDTKDWEAFNSVFAEDVQVDISDDIPGCIINGSKNIVELARTTFMGCVSVHHGHCPEIRIDSETTAVGTWAMEDMMRFSADSAYPNQTMHGYGHYFESYEKTGGSWRIKTTKLRRLRVDLGNQS